MSFCKVCSKPHSKFVMNNKLVCLSCDELMLDIEIEEEAMTPAQKPATERPTKNLVLRRFKPSTK